MLNNFIYAKTKDLFLEQLGAGNILDEAIVFIADTKEIWNHGTYYGGKTIVIDSEVSDTSGNAVANNIIKKYVDNADNTLSERIANLEQNEGGGKVYNIYYNESNNLSEEQLEANKKAYAALMSEEKAAFYLVQEGNVYSRLIVSTTMKSASTEAIAVEAHVILPTGNKTMLGTTAINLYSDGHISMTVVQNNLPSEDEVNVALEQKQDILVSGTTIKTINGQDILGEGDIVIKEGTEESKNMYYVHFPQPENDSLSDDQMAENVEAFNAWINAMDSGANLPMLCWYELPYGVGKIDVLSHNYDQIEFMVKIIFSASETALPDGVKSVEVIIMSGTLYSDGYVEIAEYSLNELPIAESFKTINGESILGSGDINISVDTNSFASKDDLDRKQNKLVNGSTIKSINNETLLGPGNITIDTSVFDTTGDNTERPMSQKATTDAINAETERALMVENELFDKIEAHEALTQQASQNAADANAYAQEAFSKSSEAVNIANTAKNAIAALEGINAGAVQEAISETIVQIEQNTTDIEVLKNSHVVLSEEEYAALELKDPDKFYIVYEE